jgi:hypothetical protein
MAEDNARARFLGTYELVEHALSFLSIADLLRTQGVSRRFRDIVCTSITLQQCLFFRPVQPSPVDSSTVVRQINPILPKHFPTLFGSVRLWKPGYEEFDMPWHKNHQRRDKFLRPHASWRRMLVSQPALYSVNLRERHRKFSRGWERESLGERSIQFPQPEDDRSLGGLRMGELYDIYVQFHVANFRMIPRVHVVWLSGDRALDWATDQDATTDLEAVYIFLFCETSGIPFWSNFNKFESYLCHINNGEALLRRALPSLNLAAVDNPTQ